MKTRALLRVTVFSVLGCFTQAAYADVWEKAWDIAAAPQIRLNAMEGNVRVQAGDSTQVKVIVKTVGWGISDSEVHMDANQEGNRFNLELKVPSNRPFLQIRHEVTVELTVPRGASLDLHTKDGNMTARGVEGSLQLNTGDGNVTAIGSKNEIRLQTGDGNINADELDGSLTAETGDGNIHVAGRFDALDARTGDGNVEVTANAGSRVSSSWKLHTGDGNIGVHMPDDVNADLDATTGDGRVSVDIPVKTSGKTNPKMVRGTINAGGNQIVIHTGDGNIHIQKQ